MSPSGGGIQLGLVLQQRSAERGAIFGPQLRRVVQGPRFAAAGAANRPEIAGWIWLGISEAQEAYMAIWLPEWLHGDSLMAVFRSLSYGRIEVAPFVRYIQGSRPWILT